MPSPDTCRLPMPQQGIVVWTDVQQRLMDVLLPLLCLRLVGSGGHGEGGKRGLAPHSCLLCQCSDPGK